MGDSAYSFSLTTFSRTGKLLQIEYALMAVQQGKTSLGIKGEAERMGCRTRRSCLGVQGPLWQPPVSFVIGGVRFLHLLGLFVRGNEGARRSPQGCRYNTYAQPPSSIVNPDSRPQRFASLETGRVGPTFMGMLRPAKCCTRCTLLLGFSQVVAWANNDNRTQGRCFHRVS